MGIEAGYMLTCDICCNEAVSTFCGSETTVQLTARRLGWKHVDGDWICPDCQVEIDSDD